MLMYACEIQEIQRLHGEWLSLMCCAATDMCLERAPAKSSVYMGNFLVELDYHRHVACEIERLHVGRVLGLTVWVAVKGVSLEIQTCLMPQHRDFCSGALRDACISLSCRMFQNVTPQTRHIRDSLCLGCLFAGLGWLSQIDVSHWGELPSAGVRCIRAFGHPVATCNLEQICCVGNSRHLQIHNRRKQVLPSTRTVSVPSLVLLNLAML